MLVTVPKWYICKKKIHNNYKIMQKHQKDSLEIDMIKNLAPLTYVKSLWLRGTTIWVIIVFCSTCETTRTGSLRSKKKKKTAKKTKQVFYQAISTAFIHLIALQSPKISNQKAIRCNNLRRSKGKKAWREFRIETNQS